MLATAAAAIKGTLGLTSDVLTATKASAYINVIDGAISIISTRRGSFGAVSNRLDQYDRKLNQHESKY